MLRDLFDRLGALPTAAVVALVAVLLIQLGLQVFGLIDLARRPRVPGGRKWVWAVVIVAGNLVGALVYLALGRSVPPIVDDRGGVGSAGTRQQALDKLYGDRDR